MYLVRDLYERHGAALGLEIAAAKEGLSLPIKVPEAQRPGLSLSGYLKKYSSERILVFGSIEIQYLRDLEKKVLKRRLTQLLKKTPAVIVAENTPILRELIEISEQKRIPLFRSSLKTIDFLSKVSFLLLEDFSPTIVCHGTLVEAFGVGVLIQGNSSVGKSEAALGLIERGHRLVADDIVKLKIREGSYLEGCGPELTRHLMEIRGIGIINVAHLYGAVCVREAKRLDLVVKLEEWDDSHFYDRSGLEEKNTEFLNIKFPFHVLPVKPGRDVVLLIETIVLNHRLKEMGYNSAKEFNGKLADAIFKKQEELRSVRGKSGAKSKS